MLIENRFDLGAPMPADIIELRVGAAEQLYHTLDPLPFRERDLDSEAEEYIVSSARELPEKADIRIQIHMPAAEAGREEARALVPAIRGYFRYRSRVVTGDLRELFRSGRQSLFIGLAVLASCIAAVQFLSRLFPASPFTGFVSEGLLILGWVANWRPIEIFLYDWWPIRRRRVLLDRLSAASIEILTEP